MKITVVADVLGVENNGTTATINRLVERLVSRGHELTVVSPFKNDESKNPRYLSVPTRNFGVFNGYMAKNNVELGRPIREVIEKGIEGADVVHIELPFKMGKLAAKLCREKHIPYTAAFHCQAENVTSHLGLAKSVVANNLVYAYFRNGFYKNVKYIHCPTEFIAHELERHKYKAEKFPISNGVVPNFKYDRREKPEEYKDKFVVLFNGRFSREKRHDLLIKAVMKSKYADKIQLILVGQGPTHEKIEKLSKKLKNPPVFGYYPKDEINKMLNWADLYCHPSDVEIEAIAALEAITCGCVPVISNSKKSATRFFAQDERCLFKAGSAQDLAKKIDYWIEHPEEKAELSKLYVEYSKKFDIEYSIDKMEEMFRHAIEDTKKLTEQGKTPYNKEEKKAV